MHYPFFLHLSENKAGEEKVAEQHTSAGEQLLEVGESLALIHRGWGTGAGWEFIAFAAIGNKDHCAAFCRHANEIQTCISLNCKNSSNCHLSKRKNELTMAYAHP